MNNQALMGIETEFKLLRTGEAVDGKEYFQDIVGGLPIPYFNKAPTCIRLATGGSFYVDGVEPEVTTAPFQIEPGAVSGVAGNLFWNIGLVLQGLKKANASRERELYLQGYSAHYSFTFPNVTSHHGDICRTLAATVNPAIQLLTENRKSSGVMFRYRENGRVEICADFIPSLEDTVAAVGFQAALLSTIDTWLEQGATVEDVQNKLRYQLPLEQISPVRTREGYILRTPEVIKKGRKAVLSVQDNSLSVNRKISAQELLEYFVELCEPAAREILLPEEQQILYDSISGKRKLPIDSQGYPQRYTKIAPVPINPLKSVSPLTRAFGNAVQSRKVNGCLLEPAEVTWQVITFRYGQNGTSKLIYVPLDCMVPFDRMIERSPELLSSLADGNITEEQKAELGKLGIAHPEALLVAPAVLFDHHSTVINIITREMFGPEIFNDPRENIREGYNLYHNLETILNSQIIFPIKENKELYSKNYLINDGMYSLKELNKIELNTDSFPELGMYFVPDDCNFLEKYKKPKEKTKYRELEEILTNCSSAEENTESKKIRKPRLIDRLTGLFE